MRSSLFAILLYLALPSFPAFSLPESDLKHDASESWQRRLSEARDLQAKGALPVARKLYESLLPVLRASKADAELGRVLNDLSQIASAQGQYETAVSRARESAEVYRELRNTRGEARALNSMGAAYLYRGDYAASLAQFQQALSLYRSAGDTEGEAEQLSNLGGAFFFQARYLDALRTYESLMDRLDKSAGEPWHARRRQIALNNLAALFQRLGQDERALAIYRQLQDSPQALRTSEQGRLLNNVGAAYRRLGDPVKALATYRAAQRLFAREQHADGQLGVLKNIGIVQALDLHDLRGALRTFSSALALAERARNRREIMQAHLYRGETLYRLNQSSGDRKDFEAALLLARDLGTAEEQWKALYGLGRTAARAGREDLAADYFRQSIASIESIRSRLQLSSLKADFFADKREVYDALIEGLLSKPDAKEPFRLMERSRARNLQDRLQPAALQGGSNLSLEDIQSRLDSATLLLEFWVTSQSAAVVWVTRTESGVTRRRLSPADLLEISSFGENLAAHPDQDWRPGSERLSKLLLSGIEPLARHNLHHLLIVSDAFLHSVPFDILQDGSKTPSLLVERFDISYLPSAALLLHNSSTARKFWAFPWERQLLAFGDPVVTNRGNRALYEVLPGDETLISLPRSAEEVHAIARMCRGRAELYLGVADLKKHLLQGRARGVPLLHLSTHATADTDAPEGSRILFSPASPGAPADYLFLKEIYDLDLRGVDLATLSACETERGKLIRGEGIQGFSRAFLSAGVRATVTTLWRVTDQPTTEFMKQFYYALGQGESKAEALQSAKLKFHRADSSLRHPKHWAAFVVTGDGLRPIPRALSWSTVLSLAAAALLVMGIVVRRLRSFRALR